MLLVIFFIEPAARPHWDRPDLVVSRSHAEYLTAGGTIVAHRADIFAVQHWRDIAQMLGSVADRQVVAIREVPCSARSLATFHGRNAARKNKQNVGAKFFQVLFLTTAKTLTEADQKEQRPHSPGDPEHGQK